MVIKYGSELQKDKYHKDQIGQKVNGMKGTAFEKCRREGRKVFMK